MNVIEALKELGIDYREQGQHHHATQGWIQMDCPRCSPNSKRFRLGLNLWGRYLSCWVCGGMPLLQNLADLSGLPVKRVREVMGDAHADLLVGKHGPHSGGRLQLPPGLGPLQKPHLDYLESRGFHGETLERMWGVKGIDHTGGHLSWRVFIPIALASATRSWTTRATVDREDVPKYRNARPEQEHTPGRFMLYGRDHVRHAVVIHEGPADVWRVGPGSVALMGAGATQVQLNALASIPLRYVCLDNEPQAQIRARKLCEDLAPFPGRTHMIYLDSAKDVADASEKDVMKIRSLLWP